MQALNSLVISGKVLYLGISNAPAWVVTFVLTTSFMCTSLT